MIFLRMNIFKFCRELGVETASLGGLKPLFWWICLWLDGCFPRQLDQQSLLFKLYLRDDLQSAACPDFVPASPPKTSKNSAIRIELFLESVDISSKIFAQNCGAKNVTTPHPWRSSVVLVLLSWGWQSESVTNLPRERTGKPPFYSWVNQLFLWQLSTILIFDRWDGYSDWSILCPWFTKHVPRWEDPNWCFFFMTSTSTSTSCLTSTLD